MRFIAWGIFLYIKYLRDPEIFYLCVYDFSIVFYGVYFGGVCVCKCCGFC